MKIGITGATGFIGQLLLKKHLDLGDTVHILSRKESTTFAYHQNLIFQKGDLLDLSSLDAFLIGVDVLYHCAAEIREESKMQEVNVEGTKNLLKAGAGKIKHWVQLSSVGVYGPIYSGQVTEQNAYNPINQYEKTKLQSDLLVLDSAQKFGFTYTLIRPSNVFGAEMSNASLFQLVKMIDSGYYFFIGPKGASANYIAVGNVVHALLLASSHPMAKNEIYNISSWTTLEHFIAIIARELGKPMPKYRVPLFILKSISGLLSVIPKNPLTISRVEAMTNRSIYLTNKIEEQLGYKAVVSTETTIAQLVKFYKKNN